MAGGWPGLSAAKTRQAHDPGLRCAQTRQPDCCDLASPTDLDASSGDGELPRAGAFELVSRDAGRLLLNRPFERLLAANGLDSFDALWNYTGGAVAKNLLRERTTTRIELAGPDGMCAVYLKRHAPPPWKEYVKPLFRLTWPIVGARNEWNALLAFHAAGIPTMTPVAFGESGRWSFLVTAAIEGCEKLSHRLEARLCSDGPGRVNVSRGAISAVARTARAMHSAGLHHQDFYLTHLLAPRDAVDPLYVIDLGRARQRRSLAARWIVKDLAQLDYSARGVSATDRCRFLHEYLGRRPTPEDRRLLRQVLQKSARILRHSKKNRL